MCLSPQEIFEARYLKVPQEPEGCSIPCQRVVKEKGDRVGSLSTSASSVSESSSEAESSSEEVAIQLANLEERVGNGANGFWEVIHFSAFHLIVSLMADSSVESCQQSAEETFTRPTDETKEKRQVEEGKKI